MTFWDFAIIVALLLAPLALIVMDHHERMARIKYTQGHNKQL